MRVSLADAACLGAKLYILRLQTNERTPSVDVRVALLDDIFEPSFVSRMASNPSKALVSDWRAMLRERVDEVRRSARSLAFAKLAADRAFVYSSGR